MLRFKEFLIETPNPPNVKDLQDFTFQKEAGGNEKAVLRLHGGPNDPTIAYGHSLQDPERSRAKFKRILPEVNFDDILSGKGELTPEQAQTLFDDDTKENLEKLKKLIPNLDDYTPEAQKGLYSSSYRGVLGQSPKAVALLNAGKFDEGANELLNNDEYRKSKAKIPIKGRILSGIAPRMEEESNLIRGEAKRREAIQKQPKVQQTTPPPSANTPAPKPEPTPTSTTQSQTDDYTIQSGDTLWKLTKGDSEKIKQIQATNPNLDPSKMQIGQKIKIPR